MGMSALASALSAVFAVTVWGHWLRRRQPAFAAWGLGLAIFSAAALTQALGQAGGFSVPLFRAFYLLGGVLGVIYLGLGTIFLLAPLRVGQVCAAALGLLTLACAADAAVVPVDAARLDTAAGVLGGALVGHGTLLFVAAVSFNIIGTVVLAGGSAWSAVRFFRGRAGMDRILCNLLLTAGALVVAGGFSLAKTVGGSLTQLGVAESIGIAVMFLGFLSLGRVGVRVPARSPSPGRAPSG